MIPLTLSMDQDVAERNLTREERVLARYPEIRETVLASPSFAEWLSGLPALEVDGETLYVRGGDTLRDLEQLIFEWARKAGLLTDEAIRRAEADAPARPPEDAR